MGGLHHRENAQGAYLLPGVSCKKNCFRGLSSWSSDYFKVNKGAIQGGIGDQ